MSPALIDYRVVRTALAVARVMSERNVGGFAEFNEIYDGNEIVLSFAEEYGLRYEDLEQDDWEVGNAIVELANCVVGECEPSPWSFGETLVVAGYAYTLCGSCSRLIRLRRFLGGWHWCG